jgi:ABC-type sugar transport system ATPase subunit
MAVEFVARAVSKSYDSVSVLSGANIELRGGTVHSVVGENGAGKSTLMKCLTGVVRPDEGTLLLNGEEVIFSGPADATRRGVVMVHQELALVPQLSVADNIMLPRPPGAPWRHRGGKGEAEFVRAALEKAGLEISPRTLVSELSVAQAYQVEIAKALALEAQVVIFDEPTAALPADESEQILNQIRQLTQAGCAVVFISHRLHEVRAISNEITVMRDGRIVGHFAGPVTEDEMIRLMVDRPVSLYKSLRPTRGDEVVLEVQGLTTSRVRDVSFSLRKGEILGFAGLVGAGRTETVLALAGVDTIRRGSVVLNGESTTSWSTMALKKAGLVLVPEDRKQQGIIRGLSAHENLHSGNLSWFLRFGMLNFSALRKASEDAKSLFDIRLNSFWQSIETLSGGNQQKVILARAMETEPSVLILDEPTRGVDVKAKDEIHQLILKLAEQGTSVILVSSEIDEVLALAHRVIVFAEGTITGEAENEDGLNAAKLMRMATPQSHNQKGRS